MTPTPRYVLAIDDEPQVAQIISFALENENLEVLTAHTAHDGWSLFERHDCCLVILDVMLPDSNGYDLCRRIRSTKDIPVIMLTALGDTDDRVTGLEAGADDHLAKPFSPKELILRVRAIMRRYGLATTHTATTICCGPIILAPASHAVHVNGTRLDVTTTESRLLQALITRPEEIVPLRALLNEVWETSATQGGRNMVKSTAYRLRRKLEAAGLPAEIITAVRGAGYVFTLEPLTPNPTQTR
ncbi:Phosphate regulon transcriptional regulatory protein phoB [Dermatophilus congolensis]|uniref:Phosphate regulon transcriptional regulatory protein phoB n=1 Tax=Dermatophilus congolensis TaxID=1863 RepID=A0AA46BPG8_9MICO|nr:response regulator transcription factor [Dermatophilus congolensis]STD13140.1 Phosphate regulon transcriptional regulatory protein phoB [Dermatophilus congolensis]